jgi:hypothetical protein
MDYKSQLYNASMLATTMVTFQNAYELAKFYSKNMGEVFPDIYFDVKPGREFKDCFYFDFTMVDKFGNTPKELQMAGGAPGVIVYKLAGEVKTINFGELAKLN